MFGDALYMYSYSVYFCHKVINRGTVFGAPIIIYLCYSSISNRDQGPLVHNTDGPCPQRVYVLNTHRVEEETDVK